MSTWIIIRSYPHADTGEFYYPVICGAYKSKRNAIEQILKLLIEDNLSSGDDKDLKRNVKEQRTKLLEGKVLNTYTNLGNIYTLGECIIDKTYDFDRDVKDFYSRTK